MISKPIAQSYNAVLNAEHIKRVANESKNDYYNFVNSFPQIEAVKDKELLRLFNNFALQIAERRYKITKDPNYKEYAIMHKQILDHLVKKR